MIHVSRAHDSQVIDQGKFVIKLVPLGSALDNHSDQGLYQLGRLDHAILQPGVTVPMHLHRNDEILSYMRRGTMHHTDSDGTDAAIHSRHLMMMNAGSGFHHEEAVRADAEEPVELLQIFMRPQEDDLEPAIQFYAMDSADSINAWRLLGGDEQSGAPLKINSRVQFFDTKLVGHTMTTPDLQDTTGLLYVFDGDIRVVDTDIALDKGSSLIIKNQTIDVSAEASAELVFFVFDETASYSRNGLFAR